MATLHSRTGSIKRTPSDLSTALASVDLPDPTAITNLGLQRRSSQQTDTVNNNIGDLDLDEPEALTMFHRRRESEIAREAMSEAISSLDLGIPERVARASAKADAIKTPDAREKIVEESLASGATTPAVHANDIELVKATNVEGQDGEVKQVVTPWDVKGAVVEGVQMGIDYNHLIEQFGTKLIDQPLLDRFERLTGRKPHLLLRRGTFFSHREFDLILDRYEAGKPFYLYTGRGPSSDSMHLGHMIPFVFTQWLQDVFDVPLVVQLTDDEKFLFKPDLKLDQCHKYAFANARDVIACGFKLDKTFIFSDLDFVGGAFYRNVVQISRCITAGKSQQTFGFELSDNIGKWHFVAVQAAPSFSNSFPQIFGTNSSVPCLIPCAIDQDPYFRITREVASKLRYPKPSLIHAKFIPSLLGSQSKMSASSETSSVFMTDSEKTVKNKINKFAFSGGGATAEEHKERGGNPDVDVAFQYLTFFLEDDVELERVEKEYRAGRIMTGELKAMTIKLINEFVQSFQARKALVTDDIVKQFMDSSRIIDPVSSKPAIVQVPIATTS